MNEKTIKIKPNVNWPEISKQICNEGLHIGVTLGIVRINEVLRTIAQRAIEINAVEIIKELKDICVIDETVEPVDKNQAPAPLESICALDSIAPDDPDFRKYLKKNNIILLKKEKLNVWELFFQGTEASLKKMIDDFWDDEDLYSEIADQKIPLEKYIHVDKVNEIVLDITLEREEAEEDSSDKFATELADAIENELKENELSINVKFSSIELKHIWDDAKSSWDDATKDVYKRLLQAYQLVDPSEGSPDIKEDDPFIPEAIVSAINNIELLLEEYDFEPTSISNQFSKGKRYIAIISNNVSVTICKYTPKYKRLIDTTTFTSQKQLKKYLEQNHCY